MSDTKWGFEKNYGHRTLPAKWHTSSGFSAYDGDCLRKKSPFRPQHIPHYRENLLHHNTSYVERSQDERFAMSNYGCHKELSWGHSLRNPRNPFPGRPTRETQYIQQPTPTYKAGSLPGDSPSSSKRLPPMRSQSTPSLRRSGSGALQVG